MKCHEIVHTTTYNYDKIVRTLRYQKYNGYQQIYTVKTASVNKGEQIAS